ncbi:hypothetical protein F2Q69_00009887 [Brassica cretica]|uniref:Uncharacterized protein n=1 Tax=Brassica cretica TaxID=69181 RepID=A0A8S9PF36_BRACR|nr:hypothetical protein F2Q69_00009887 [Brassica cretica]
MNHTDRRLYEIGEATTKIENHLDDNGNGRYQQIHYNAEELSNDLQIKKQSSTSYPLESLVHGLVVQRNFCPVVRNDIARKAVPLIG